jgi:hypothetical protein
MFLPLQRSLCYLCVTVRSDRDLFSLYGSTLRPCVGSVKPIVGADQKIFL